MLKLFILIFTFQFCTAKCYQQTSKVPTQKMLPPPILGHYSHSRTDPRQQTSLVNPKIDPYSEVTHPSNLRAE